MGLVLRSCWRPRRVRSTAVTRTGRPDEASGGDQHNLASRNDRRFSKVFLCGANVISRARTADLCAGLAEAAY